jgi:hypothetical protein
MRKMHTLRIEVWYDWTVALVDGVLVAEAHSINVESPYDFGPIAKALGVNLEIVEMDGEPD